MLRNKKTLNPRDPESAPVYQLETAMGAGIGQHRNVLVHRLICRGTIEDRIDAMLKNKSRMADDLFSGGPEQWLLKMSAEELNNLFSGSPC